MTVKELKEYLNQFPDSYEVLIPIDINHGFASTINTEEYEYCEFYKSDYSKTYGQFELSDCDCNHIQREDANAIILWPKEELLFEERLLKYNWE